MGTLAVTDEDAVRKATRALNFLRSAATAIHGDDWQTPVARALGGLHPDGARDSLDPRLVRRWASGERPVPGWVHGAMAVLLGRAADARRAEARLMERLIGLFSDEASRISAVKKIL